MADRFEKSPSQGVIDTSFTSAAIDAAGRVAAIVELKSDPVAVVEANSDAELSDADKEAVKSKLQQEQEPVKSQIKQKGGTVNSQMQSAYNGMRVTVARSELSAIAGLPNVKAIHPVVYHEPTNSTSIPYLGVDQVWKNTGYTGKNVKVAIIDTGIDYTHATFGGPGTVAAYEAAKAASAQAADPALFGPQAPRVKGGWDFVGDDYTGGANSVPKPDANPLDCHSHGTHVAGSTGGGGVLSDGTAYTGPYDNTTSERSFRVGPGVAPQVDLYALKVFGCSGSTGVTTEAIDWSVANGMQVINMSLGSPYGTATDPSAVAASNAAAAGVVVVASAGNNGPNPYLTGSPASGRGVISVAANDPTESFPGANVQIGATRIEAINANGAVLPADQFQVVVLRDNPATAENEALGCSAAAYTSNGISAAASPKQIAVTTRGTCARVARGVYGQQAGAGAVVMINNAVTLPPYEGEIRSNPDDDSPYQVTIPFLGVRSSDGPALIAAAGQTLTLSAVTIANPGFSGYGSFTSAGPRSGDSGLKPSVTAPGVSIASAAVGTGNDVSVMSGTSMAAPMAAGVAALTVQAHPTWSSQDLAAAIVSTADPGKIAGYQLTRGGGLVDVAAAVSTGVVAVGDSYRTEKGDRAKETSLSFGFADFSTGYVGTKWITLINNGSSAATFEVSAAPTTQSRPAKVTLITKKVTVPPRQSRVIPVTVAVDAKSVPTTSVNEGGQAKFYEVSGNIVLKSKAQTLRVPYLLVPRASSLVTALQFPFVGSGDKVTTTMTNFSTSVTGSADFYTWGLEDPKDLASKAGDVGYDLRAVGVQSADMNSDKLIVFALNLHDRYSNAASAEYDVLIDTDGDGKDDYVVLSADSGQVRTKDPNGLAEVFLYNIKTKKLSATGFMAGAPTDSSTILLPVLGTQLGLSADKGQFSYTAATSSTRTDGKDEITQRATYNPWKKALSDGNYVEIAPFKTVRESQQVDRTALAAQAPLGTMVVVLDNQAGRGEALTLRAPKA